MKLSIIGFLLGALVGFLIWLAERTTGNIAWGLVICPSVSWACAGYMFYIWKLYQ
jgi:hypothetical protein